MNTPKLIKTKTDGKDGACKGCWLNKIRDPKTEEEKSKWLGQPRFYCADAVKKEHPCRDFNDKNEVIQEYIYVEVK